MKPLALLLLTCLVPGVAYGSNARRIVADFYELGWVKREPAAAFRRYVGGTYIQHNPAIADGAPAAVAYLEKRLHDNPQISFDVRHVVAEGNFVVLHVLVKATPEDRGRAFVDIFRVDRDKIVEHWDVVQPIPDAASNSHPMF